MYLHVMYAHIKQVYNCILYSSGSLAIPAFILEYYISELALLHVGFICCLRSKTLNRKLLGPGGWQENYKTTQRNGDRHYTDLKIYLQIIHLQGEERDRHTCRGRERQRLGESAEWPRQNVKQTVSLYSGKCYSNSKAQESIQTWSQTVYVFRTRSGLWLQKVL